MDHIGAIEPYLTPVVDRLGPLPEAHFQTPADARRFIELVFKRCVEQLELPNTHDHWRLINFLLDREVYPGFNLIHHCLVYNALKAICGYTYYRELRDLDSVYPPQPNINPFAFVVVTRMLQIVLDNIQTQDLHVSINTQTILRYAPDDEKLCDNYAQVFFQYEPFWDPWELDNIPETMLKRLYFHGDYRLKKQIETDFLSTPEIEIWRNIKAL